MKNSAKIGTTINKKQKTPRTLLSLFLIIAIISEITCYNLQTLKLSNHTIPKPLITI